MPELLGGRTPLIPLSLIGAGAYLAWFGVHYWKSNTAWPSAPIKAVLTGQAAPSNAIDTSDQQAITDAFVNSETGIAGTSTTGAPAGTGVVAQGRTYDHAGLQTLWTSNGGNPARANLAAAVGQAESGGNSAATSPNPDGGINAGIWQLDTKGKGAGYTVAQLQDPVTNVRVTIMATGNGVDWSAWATFADGTYKNNLQ